jgi:DNA-binding NarL/FixJ family response regulator
VNKSGNEINVMIVDDNPVVRADLRTLLTLIEGVRVAAEAESASSAVQAAVTIKPDLLILDLQLRKDDESELSGLAVLRRIKLLLPACKVFVLTVHDYEKARKGAVLAGADAFFVKGRETLELFSVLQNLVHTKEIQYSQGE